MVRAQVAAVLVAALVCGCSREEEERLPVACRDTGVRQLESALRAAPQPVELGGTPLSECISKANDAADIQTMGATFLAVAGRLVPEARENPEGSEALRLGYLVGAARRGADRTPGFHDEMVRRLEQEAAPVERRSAAFAEGERAGRESG